mmetsp:Transcript_19639/g.63805  ORF Transcript_19639/g.63805 Transcript_19639/m.63805 type:complete len:326 (+) Transcript_19639:3-980(+)
MNVVPDPMEQLKNRRSSFDENLVGKSTTVAHKVADTDCAYTQRSGGVKTLSTAKLSAIIEDACVEVLEIDPKSGFSTAGCAVNLKHLAPMPVGSTILVKVTVSNTIRRQVAFAYEVRDELNPLLLVATGTHQRAFVKISEMQQTLAAKMAEKKIEAGLLGTSTHFVDVQHLGGALEFGGTVEALSTASLMTWAEEAAIAAVEENMPKGFTSVGAQTIVAHVAPTPRGMQVTCKAKLTSVTETKSGKKKLAFDVVGEDRVHTIMTGTHLRFLVDKSKFERRAEGEVDKSGRRRGSSAVEDDETINAMDAAIAAAGLNLDDPAEEDQ